MRLINKDDLTNLTFRGEKVFIATEVSRYCGRSHGYAVSVTYKKDFLIRSKDYYRLSPDECIEFYKENASVFIRSNIKPKYLFTVSGFKKIYDYSASRIQEFPFEEIEENTESVEIVESKPETKEITELEIKEYKGQRVITFKDIDEVHGRPEGTAGRNFRHNKLRFLENEDYFFVKPNVIQTTDKIRRSGINNSGSYLLTESGYLVLVKSFTDDLAWEVQRKLVNTYFRVKQQTNHQLPTTFAEALRLAAELEEQKEKLLIENEQMKPKVEKFDHLMDTSNWQDMNEVAKVLKTGRTRLFRYLREHEVILKDKPLPYQKYCEKGYFKVVDVEKEGLAFPKTVVSPLGIDFMMKLFKNNPPKKGFFDKIVDLFTPDEE